MTSFITKDIFSVINIIKSLSSSDYCFNSVVWTTGSVVEYLHKIDNAKECILCIDMYEDGNPGGHSIKNFISDKYRGRRSVGAGTPKDNHN